MVGNYELIRAAIMILAEAVCARRGVGSLHGVDDGGVPVWWDARVEGTFSHRNPARSLGCVGPVEGQVRGVGQGSVGIVGVSHAESSLRSGREREYRVVYLR